jgi:hypothetical protein
MVTLRYAGPHASTTEILRDNVRIYLPGAVVTIGDDEAARSIDKVWRDAGKAIGKIFPTEDRAPGYQIRDEVRILASVALVGWIQGRDIQGKIPSISPSGCGELRVRLGSLMIVMDDRFAAQAQVEVWRKACDMARRLYRLD